MFMRLKQVQQQAAEADLALSKPVVPRPGCKFAEPFCGMLHGAVPPPGLAAPGGTGPWGLAGGELEHQQRWKTIWGLPGQLQLPQQCKHTHNKSLMRTKSAGEAPVNPGSCKSPALKADISPSALMFY